MWKGIEDVAKMKMVMNYTRCGVTENRWEKEWHRFVTRVWKEDTPTWKWDAKAIIYDITIP